MIPRTNTKTILLLALIMNFYICVLPNENINQNKQTIKLLISKPFHKTQPYLSMDSPLIQKASGLVYIPNLKSRKILSKVTSQEEGEEDGDGENLADVEEIQTVSVLLPHSSQAMSYFQTSDAIINSTSSTISSSFSLPKQTLETSQTDVLSTITLTNLRQYAAEPQFDKST